MKCHTALCNVGFTFGLFLLLTAGCAGMKDSPRSRTESQIEISYLRGSNSHRYLISEDKDTAMMKAFKDQYLMKEIKISQDNFTKIANETEGVVNELKRNPTAKEDSPCRTPFHIKIKGPQALESVEGCRGSNEGALVGKLIKDVEFLMASPKAEGG